MKKVRLKERFNKATEAFFENRGEEFDLDRDEMTYPNQTSLLASEEPVSDKFATIKSILKGVFFFMPGTWLLTPISFALTVVTLFGVPNMNLPTGSFGFFLRLLVIFGGGSLFTWFGIGKLRNPKHSAIPLSIISSGIILGFLFGLLTIPYPELRRLIFDSDGFIFYLLPIGLVTGVLAKNRVDSLDHQDVD